MPNPLAAGRLVVTAGWSPFWVELPVLAVCAALVLIALVALVRARREDIPNLFGQFCAFLGQVLRALPTPAKPEEPEPSTGAIAGVPPQLDAGTASADDGTTAAAGQITGGA